MKIAILGVENSHADAFGKLVKENPNTVILKSLVFIAKMKRQ